MTLDAHTCLRKRKLNVESGVEVIQFDQHFKKDQEHNRTYIESRPNSEDYIVVNPNQAQISTDGVDPSDHLLEHGCTTHSCNMWAAPFNN